jgi:hypothetical protein
VRRSRGASIQRSEPAHGSCIECPPNSQWYKWRAQVERSDHCLSHGGNTCAVPLAKWKTRLLRYPCLDQFLEAGAGRFVISPWMEYCPAKPQCANACGYLLPERYCPRFRNQTAWRPAHTRAPTRVWGTGFPPAGCLNRLLTDEERDVWMRARGMRPRGCGGRCTTTRSDRRAGRGQGRQGRRMKYAAGPGNLLSSGGNDVLRAPSLFTGFLRELLFSSSFCGAGAWQWI